MRIPSLSEPLCNLFRSIRKNKASDQKVCCRCKKVLSLSDFYIDKRSKMPHPAAVCRFCILAKHQERYDSNAKGYRDRILARGKKLYNEGKSAAAVDSVTKTQVQLGPGLDEFL